MDKKKIGYTLVIVSLLIIILGTIFFLIDSNKTKEKKEEKKTPEEIVELEKNDNLKEEHCLENICLSNMVITGNYHEYYHASVDITNKTPQTIEKKYIKVLFEVDGKTQAKFWYVDSLATNESINLDIGLMDDTLLKATSYQLENPTAAEIAEQEALLVD